MKKTTYKGFTEEEAKTLLREAMKAFGTQANFAKEHKLTPDTISRFLNGRDRLSDTIAASIGLKRTVIFVPVENGERNDHR